MSGSAPRWSRRSRKVVQACAGLLAGVVTITMLVKGIDQARETDSRDPRAGVTSMATNSGGLLESPLRFEDATRLLEPRMRHGPGTRSRLLHEDTGSGLAWADYDGDGDWDLYVVNFPAAATTPGAANGANHLYRNEGGRFVDVAVAAGVADAEGFGMGATFADYDNDGHPDLYVTNAGPNRLFRNRGDGTFEDVAVEAGVADSAWSTGAAWGDFDRDGHLDLYVCNYVDYDAEELRHAAVTHSSFGRHSVPFTLNPNSFDPLPNRLFRNRGDGTFEDVAESVGVHDPGGRSFAATFCDLDGDGWLDLYVTNDVSENKLFRNTLGDGPVPGEGQGVVPVTVELSEAASRDLAGNKLAFADLSALTGTADPRGSMGLSVGEIGQMSGTADGLPDLFVTHWLAQENALYQSEMTPVGFLEYRDKTRQYALGEVSLNRVGWGCGLADFDLDGHLDLIVANGSTLEQPDDTNQLTPQPPLLFRNTGSLFQDVSQVAGTPLLSEYNARGLALADFDDDGDADIALLDNRNGPLLLRNVSESGNYSLKVRLVGPAAACFGAKVEVRAGAGERRQTQWWGTDVSFLSMHAGELIFGLGSRNTATDVVVTWADGRESHLREIAGRVDVAHPAADR